MKNPITKKLLALVLAVLLIVGTIPVFAAGEEGIPTVVVKVGYAETEGALVDYSTELGTTDGVTQYATYSTVTEAIDSFGGEEGKIWVLGTFEGSGPTLEGTISDRKHITIAGFNDDATKGTIKFNKTTGSGANAENRDHRKGDVTFEYITLSSTNAVSLAPMVAIGSGGYVVTIGEGVVVSPSSNYLAIGGNAASTKDQKFNIYSGEFSHVAAIVMNTATNRVANFNAEYNIYDGSVAICAGTGFNNGQTLTPGYNTLNGDYKVNVYGGTVRTISLLTISQKTDFLVTGDTIYNIKGGNLTGRVTFGHYQNKNNTLAQFAGYVPPTNRGNIAAIIDVSRVTSSNNINASFIGYNHGESEDSLFQQAEGKRAIGIINNATKSNYGFNTTNHAETTNSEGITKSPIHRLHYKLTVIGGEAYPVFERTDPTDPATSYLKGFTIESSTDKGLSPYVGAEKIPVVEGYTYEGKKVYDLTAFMSDGKAYKEGLPNDDNTITNITFVDDRDPSDFIPVVSTDESFEAPDGYMKHTTLSSAIETLGADGGTIHIAGKYTISSASTEFANTADIADGKKIIITGYGENPTENELGFGDGTTAIPLRSPAWLHCDLEFNNLTLSGKASEAQGFNSNGNVITFGDNLVTNFTGYMMGSLNNNVTNKIVINSGTYNNFVPAYKTAAAYTNANAEYVINGGTFQDRYLYTGAYSGYNSAAPKDAYITGYYTFNINGGDFTMADGTTKSTLWVGSSNAHADGVTLVNVKGGNLGQIQLRPDKEYNGTAQVIKHTNKAVIIDGSLAPNTSVNSFLTGVDPKEERTTKYIVIINNQQNVTRIYNYTNGVDYPMYVTGGEAYPVFHETTAGDPSTATLKGFTITPNSANADKDVIVNEVIVTPDADGVYDLSQFEDCGLIYVSFRDKDTTDWSVYSAYRNHFNNSLNKLNNANETVTVTYIGGSVTEGVGIPAGIFADACWRELTTRWLQSSFPATIKPVNAAASGTGTTLGVYRNYNDIISHNPDILFIEFSVNDAYDSVTYQDAAAQLETMIREVKLALPNCDIAVVLVTDRGHVMDAKNGVLHTQAQAHDMVAEYYGVPTIYVGKALASLFPDGLTGDALADEWAKYSNDYVHPNSNGYTVYFKAIKGFLETVYSGDYTATNKNIDVTDASTFVSDYLMDGDRTLIGLNQTVTVENSHLAPVITDKGLKDLEITGFEQNTESVNFARANAYDGCLVLNRDTNGTIKITFTGTELTMISTIPIDSKVYCSIDGGEEQLINIAVRSRQLLTDLDPGEHTVTLRFDWALVSDTTTQKFNIYALGTRDASKATGFIRTEAIEDLDAYKNGAAIPEKNGYLFAGWYESETAEKAMTATEFAAAETAVAKFIPKAVLDIKWQIAKGEDGKANLRLISTVDSLQYQKVIFNVSVVGRETPFEPLESTTVYTGISGYVDGNEQNYAPTINSISSAYFMTHIITGIPVDFHDNEFTVSASVVTKDGQIITGDEFTFTLKSATDYDKVMGN